MSKDNLGSIIVEHFSVIMSLIGVMYAAVIGVYVFTFKVAQSTAKELATMSQKTTTELAQIYTAVNTHLQNAQIHPVGDHLVTTTVCRTLHSSLKEDLQGVKENVSEIKKDVKVLLTTRPNFGPA